MGAKFCFFVENPDSFCPLGGSCVGTVKKVICVRASVRKKRYFYACLRACLTHILGASGQAVISDFQKRSGRSAKNSSTRTIEKIAFFCEKIKKVQGLYLKVKLKLSLNWLHLDSVISEKLKKLNLLIWVIQMILRCLAYFSPQGGHLPWGCNLVNKWLIIKVPTVLLV